MTIRRKPLILALLLAVLAAAGLFLYRRSQSPPMAARLLPEGEVLVIGNPEELRTVIFNLFDNAVKYSGEKKDIVVDVRTPNMDSVLLSVQDRGIGIPKSELKRIFKRFHRAQTATAGQVKGTGLGLFIVRSVVRRYGGDVYAESAGEGRGSTFVIRLPRVYRA